MGGAAGLIRDTTDICKWMLHFLNEVMIPILQRGPAILSAVSVDSNSIMQ